MNSEANGIFHFRLDHAVALCDFLLSQGHEKEFVEGLLHQGAVFVDGRRQRQNTSLQSGQIVRLHTRPKKYRWAVGPLVDRIVFEDEFLLVLDKPSGLPVHATLDNYVENAKYVLEQETQKTVYSTHRLDIPTEGLLIFAKDAKTQSSLNGLFARRQVEKIYRAWTETSVPVGPYRLFLDGLAKVPRPHSFEPRDQWWECRLSVLKSENSGGTYCQTVSLETGRTHQIRAQFSALGAPILGDATYGSTWKLGEGRIGLECKSLRFRYRGRDYFIERQRSVNL